MQSKKWNYFLKLLQEYYYHSRPTSGTARTCTRTTIHNKLNIFLCSLYLFYESQPQILLSIIEIQLENYGINFLKVVLSKVCIRYFWDPKPGRGHYIIVRLRT